MPEHVPVLIVLGCPALGPVVKADVFAPADMRQLAADLSRADVDRTKAGARHILGLPAVRAVAMDPGMLAIAQSFVGLSAVPFRATLFDNSADANPVAKIRAFT